MAAMLRTILFLLALTAATPSDAPLGPEPRACDRPAATPQSKRLAQQCVPGNCCGQNGCWIQCPCW
jgi:hypothetical protein